MLKLVYYIGERQLRKDLSKLKNISVYRKSNIQSKYFEPGVSDLDYIIISNAENISDEITQVFNKLNKIYPFIKDFDLYTSANFMYLLEFGGVKYANPKSWKLIIGQSIEFPTYFYHPFKFLCDQLDELYFYFLWLHENKLKDNTRYRKKVIKRTLKKIFQTIDWIQSPDTFFKPKRFNLSKEQKILLSIDDEEEFNKIWYLYLKNLDLISVLKESFSPKFNKLSKYYKESDSIIDTGFYKFTLIPDNNKYVLVTRDLFDIFYFSGAVSIEVLADTSKLFNKHIYGLCAQARLGAYIINGFKLNFEKNIDIFILQQNISPLRNISVNYKNPVSYINKNVFITVNWGDDSSRASAFKVAHNKRKDQLGDFVFLHINLNHQDEINKHDIEDLNTVFIRTAAENLCLWHKEALFNWGAGFCFGYNKIIFSDAEVFSNDIRWIHKTFDKLDTYSFVQGFKTVEDTLDPLYKNNSWIHNYLNGINNFKAQGLVWGITSNYLKSIETLPDFLVDGSNDSLFLEEITGVTMGVKEEATWYHSKKRSDIEVEYSYVDVDTIHVNHGATREYVNRVEMMTLFAKDLESLYKKNELGLYVLVDATEPLNQLIIHKSKLFEYSKERTLPLLKKLIQSKLISQPKKFTIIFGDNQNSSMSLYNCVGVIEKLKNELEITTFSIKSDEEEIHLLLNLGSIYFTEHRAIRVRISGAQEITELNLLNDWTNYKGENDINNTLFNNQSDKEVCLTSYSFEEQESLRLELKIKGKYNNCPIKIKFLEDSRVSVVHAWDLITTLESYKRVLDTLVFPLDITAQPSSSWWAYEISFDSTNLGSFETMVRFNQNQPFYSAKREFEGENAENAKILFFHTLTCIDQQIIIKSDSDFLRDMKNIKIRIFKRALLD